MGIGQLASKGLATIVLATAATAGGAVGDFTGWTLVQDPAHPSFTAAASTTDAKLFATGGPIPAATDIGYQSVNATTPAGSTGGFAFSPTASFSVAIDYGVTFSNTPTGTLAIGFGIGKDKDGEDSAGTVQLFNNGVAGPLGAAARDNNVADVLPMAFSGSASGSFFAAYDHTTQNITLGASPTAGAPNATLTATYLSLQDDWNAGDLLVSFFLRSDSSFTPAWQSGNATATFSNFRVLSGQPTIVPEPACAAGLVLAGMLLIRRGRQ